MKSIWDSDTSSEHDWKNDKNILPNLSPRDLAELESNGLDTLIKETCDFAAGLKSCGQIVEAAYTKSDYTPSFQNNEQEIFWLKEVNPILVGSLDQHITAKSTIIKGFGAVRDLAITIKSAYDILKIGKGNKKSIERYNYLIESSEKLLKVSSKDLNESKDRINNLMKLNKEMEDAINNIPKTIKKTVKETGSSGWWIFKTYHQGSNTVEVENKNREQDRKHYESIIKARKQRLLGEAKDEKEKQAAIEMLLKELAEYKIMYKQAAKELKLLKDELPKNLNDIEKDIQQLLDDRNKIDEIAADTFEKIGLQGSTLVKLLSQVRIFARSLEPGSSAYSPFSVILNSIKMMVEGLVDLLGDDNETSVYLAMTLLLKKGLTLSQYSVVALQIFQEQGFSSKI